MDFKLEIGKAIAIATELNNETCVAGIEIPPNNEMGDYAFPCFRLAKELRKAPPVIAKEISEKIVLPEFIEKIEIQGAYINFFTNKSYFVNEVLTKVLTEKENYGKSTLGKGKTIVIDYSSPNIAKPFHVGHLRSTVIGNAIYKIHEFLGYNCEGVNHLGDWGTQFGKLIVAYKNWGSSDAVEEKGIEELMRIYVKFHDEAKNNPALEDEARLWFVKMQDGDEEALSLWK
ncbi:MAG: arginine--tRNA ligase, partial [Anaerotignaceae bacterium]